MFISLESTVLELLLITNLKKQDQILPPVPLTYVPFNDPEMISTTYYNYATQKQVTSGNIARTLINSIMEGVPVAKFEGAQRTHPGAVGPIGTSDFTIEMWCYVDPADLELTGIFYSNVRNIGGYVGTVIGMTTGQLYTVTNTGTSRLSELSIPAGQWFHACMMRKDGVIYPFINGVPGKSYAYASNITLGTPCIGAYVSSAGASRFFKGLMSEVGVSKNARYPVTGFTPKYPIYN